MDEILTVKEFKELAAKTPGGRYYAKYWGKKQLNKWAKLYGPMTRADALELFQIRHQVAVELGYVLTQEV